MREANKKVDKVRDRNAHLPKRGESRDSHSAILLGTMESGQQTGQSGRFWRPGQSGGGGAADSRPCLRCPLTRKPSRRLCPDRQHAMQTLVMQLPSPSGPPRLAAPGNSCVHHRLVRSATACAREKFRRRNRSRSRVKTPAGTDVLSSLCKQEAA